MNKSTKKIIIDIEGPDCFKIANDVYTIHKKLKYLANTVENLICHILATKAEFISSSKLAAFCFGIF